MPVLPGPAVPVEDCSRRHFWRSSPSRVSQRPLDELPGAALVAPLVPTLEPELESSDRGLVVPPAPAESALVPVEGPVDGTVMLRPDGAAAQPAGMSSDRV